MPNSLALKPQMSWFLTMHSDGSELKGYRLAKEKEMNPCCGGSQRGVICLAISVRYMSWVGVGWRKGLCLNARFLTDSNPFSQHSDLNLQAR